MYWQALVSGAFWFLGGGLVYWLFRLRGAL